MGAENAKKNTWLNGRSKWLQNRTNDELQVTYRKPNIVTTTTVRRLEGAGHLVRMSDDRTVEKAFRGKPDGIIKAGRPK
jgi:hypothetical protein